VSRLLEPPAASRGASQAALCLRLLPVVQPRVPRGGERPQRSGAGVSRPTTPRDVALHLIRVYVERGDSLQSLRDGLMGASVPGGYSAQISDYMPVGKGGKYWSPDRVLVTREGNDVQEAFKLKQLYDEIKSGKQTLPLG
jgi:hypothetical protein